MDAIASKPNEAKFLKTNISSPLLRYLILMVPSFVAIAMVTVRTTYSRVGPVGR